MISRQLLIITIGIALLTSFSLFSAPVTLAENGQAQATIVLQSKASQRLKLAAQDLQKYIKMVCGVELPLRRDGAKVAGTGLYIGKCEPTLPQDAPTADLNPESFAIRVRDGNMFFSARYDTPAAFAVYTFLEDTLGIRWYAPGDLWEDVPKGTEGSLTVDVSDRVVVPDTSPRIWSGHYMQWNWYLWQLRNKTLQGEVIPRRQFQNRLHNVFPPEKYASEHPEYYPLCNGKRFIPSAGNRLWRPCESNPEVQRLTVEYIRKYFDEHPDEDSFSLGMDDISHLCSCENCRAMDPHPDSYEKSQFSDRHYKFVNIIAKEIAKTHPDHYIGTLIYNIAKKLPETVPVLEPNVFGYITETSAYWWKEGQQEADHNLTKEWRKCCQHLSRYDYYGFASMAPRYYPTYVDQQMKFDKKLGMEGMFVEIYSFLPLSLPMIWQLAKLQWDHALNSNDILAELRHRLYGDAAPSMTAFWDLLEKSYQTPREGRGAWEHRNIVNMALAISLEDWQQAMKLLDQATAAANNEKIRQRIDIHRDGMRLTSYVIKPFYLSQKYQGIKIATEEEAVKVIEAAAEVSQLALEREEFLASLEDRKDLLGLNYYGLNKKTERPYMPIGNFNKLEFDVVSASFRALAWYEQNAPQKLTRLQSRLGDRLLGNKLISAYLAVSSLSEKPANLMVNGDFEYQGPNETPAAHDWTSEGVPHGWNAWASSTFTLPSYQLKPGEGRNNSTAITITNAGSTALFLQSVSVNPGDLLLCTGWVKGTGAGTMSFGFRLHDKSGKWHSRRDLESSVGLVAEATSDWQPVALQITAPEDCGKVVVMLGAKNQKEDSCVWFDDIELIKYASEK